MKKCFVIILLICTMLTCFSSCRLPVSEGHSLSAVGSFAIPGMFISDLRGASTEIEVQERDDYGRILFRYTAYNEFTKQTEDAMVICQKYNQKKVYFYEDVCYLISDISNISVDELKSANDWNLPLDESKMSIRSYYISFDLFLSSDYPISTSRSRVEKAYEKYFKDSGNQIVSFWRTDLDEGGKNLHIVILQNADGVEEQYFSVIDSSYQINVMKITDYATALSQLREFKKQCGWKYPQNDDQTEVAPQS